METRDEAASTCPGDDVSPTLPAAPAGASAPAALTGQMGRYVVLRPIGAGGMGVVYEAYDPRLERKIALKLLRNSAGAGESAGTMQDRLLREAQAMARLSHPNVVAVHDAGTFDGRVFIAMEFVAGITLSAWLRERRHGLQEVLRVFLEAGAGLAAAHAAGIVHRDFKPDNVLISADGRVRVTDFGLARPAGATSDAPGQDAHVPVDLTVSGQLLGTPAYMAPEQLLCQQADARSDQFNFCIALYEALYGARPYTAKTIEELRAAMHTGPVTPPRDRRVPARIRRILLRGLSQERGDRYPSMEALLRDLRRSRRSRKPRVLMGLLLLGLLAGSLFTMLEGRRQARMCKGAERKLSGIWNADRKGTIQRAFLATGMPYARDAWTAAERTLDAYAAKWVAMHTEACEATRMRGEQSEELLDLRMQCLDRRLLEMRAVSDLWAEADAQVVEKAVVTSQTLSDLADCANPAALRTWLRPPADPALRKRVDGLRTDLVRTRALELSGKLPEALKNAREAAQAARALDYLPVEAEALCLEGEIQAELGDFKAAEGALMEAAAAAQASQHDEVAARTWIDLMHSVGYKMARYEQGLRWNRYAVATLARVPGSERLEARRLDGLGLILWSQGHHDEALAVLQKALGLVERNGDSDQLVVAGLLEAMAFLYTDQGRLEEALVLEQRALAVRERRLGSQHPDLALNLNNLGYVLWTMGRHREALPYLERSLAIYEQTGPDHPETAVVLDTLGRVLASLGQPDQALRHLQRAVLLLEKATPAHPDVARILLGLGQIYRQKQRPDQALVQHRKALGILEAAFGPGNREVGLACYEIGEDLLMQGQKVQARSMLRRALDILMKSTQDEHEQLQRVQAALRRTGEDP